MTILVEMSITSWVSKSKIQKNGLGREIHGLEILSMKVALQNMGVNELAWRVQGMRRQKGHRTLRSNIQWMNRG